MYEELPITILVQTKNEAVGIAKCLASLQNFSEVIVVDSNSSDGTPEIAASLGATVINFTWNGVYPKKKQWQLENVQTKHDWIMFVDADEFPTAEFLDELNARRQELIDRKYAAYDISLEYVFAGRALGHGHRVVKRALLDRTRCSFPEIDDLDAPGMGELEGHYQPVAQGDIGMLRTRLLHDDQDPVSTWFDRHNRYSEWEAYLRTNPKIQAETAKRRSLQGRLFDRIPFKPLSFFIFAYVVKAGFLDGRAGFDYAFALSSYYWQIDLKVRELGRQSQMAKPHSRSHADSAGLDREGQNV